MMRRDSSLTTSAEFARRRTAGGTLSTGASVRNQAGYAASLSYDAARAFFPSWLSLRRKGWPE